MWKTFKAFFNKDGYNYSTGLVDPFEFHLTFYKVLVCFKVADLHNNYKPSWLNQNGLIFTTGFIATFLTLLSFIHGICIFDIPHITEAGTYFIVMSYELLILSCTTRNLPQYYNLQRAMKEDFYLICNTGQKYREKYFENQLITWKISIIACIFVATIGIGIALYSIVSLFYFLATHQPGDQETRPLLFPFWLPNVDFGSTPYYEVAFVFANVCAVTYAYNYIFMIQTEIVWIRHIASKVDIVVWSIEDLLNGVYPATNDAEKEYFSKLITQRFHKIIKHHQAMLSVMTDYAIVYKKMLMFEQKCCGPVICLTAYCTAEKLDNGEIQGILPLLFIGTVVLYFIPSYFCTFLALKVRSICDACWNIPFWIAGPVIRPYMLLIMQRSLRPLPLTAAGFEPISIETFSKTITSAYSFFNMLRQINL